MNLKSLFQCCFPRKDENEKKVGNDIEVEGKEEILYKKKSDDDKSSSITKNSLISQMNTTKFAQNNKESDVQFDFKSITSNVIFQKGDKSSDESSLDFLGSARKIDDDDIKFAPVLYIEEIEGEILKNQSLTINATGLVNGQRKMKDGVAFFGNKLKNGEEVINDYVFNITDYPENISHIFIIYYKKETNKYYIRAYKEKHSDSFPIVLIRLDNQFPAKKKQIIKIDYYFFHIIPFDDHVEIYKMDTREKNSPTKSKFTFNISDSPVTIGRNKDCHIAFIGDRSFSRIHCNIAYDTLYKCWIIKDGYDKPSTNGIWIYAKHSYELQNGTCFRIQNSIFKVLVKE